MSALWSASAHFEGKVAIVTGAGRGMGREIALTLARGGALVAVVERDAESAGTVSEEVRGLGGEALSFICDVLDPEAAARTVQKVVDQFGHVDILVNNAGIATTTRPLETITNEEWETVVGVNLTGTFNFMRAVLPLMKAQRSGKIVNISSSAGRSVSTFAGAHYTASKAAVLGLTRHAAHEAAPYNVNVNAIAPGTIDTPMLRGVAVSDRIEAEAQKIPMRRLGTVADIANLVAFLASSASDYITGATVDINGGDLIL